MFEELGLEKAKPCKHNNDSEQSGKMDSDSLALCLWDATLYRRLVAKLNYLAMDRPDIRYAASIHGKSRIKSERCRHGHTQERRGNFRSGDRSLGRTTGGECGDFGTIACDNLGVVDHTARQGLGLAKHVPTRHLWLCKQRGTKAG